MAIRLCFIFTGFLLLTGCDKEDLKWNLSKVDRLPVLITKNADNIDNSSAYVNSEIQLDGGSSIIKRGVCWSIDQNPTISNSLTNDGTGVGVYSSLLSNLDPNTTYYVRAYATNNIGTAYGNQISFTTTNSTGNLPVLATSSASNVTINSANSGGLISNDGGSNIIERGVCWSTNQNPTISDNITNDGTGLGSFTSLLSNLNPNTTYYVRAYATNNLGTAYGNQISFTTDMPIASSVGTNDCSSLSGITSTYYGLSGTSAPWGLSSSGYSGNCWVAPDPNNSGQLGSAVGSNHFVQFSQTFNNQGYIEFWVNTYNPGYDNLTPVISVNGNAIGNATMIGGQISSSSWMKVRTPIIPAGNNTIKLLLSGNYYVLKIDELEYFEY